MVFSGSILQAEFIRGRGMDGGAGGILYSLRAGEASFTHYNNRGDVIAKTDEAGANTYQAAYEAFGKRLQEDGSTDDRQKANTKEEDPTGLLNEGFRYRDLETGVFITRDPLGFVDGPNMYTYVIQNPWSKFDPAGLSKWEIGKRFEDAVSAVRKSLAETGKINERRPRNFEWKGDIKPWNKIKNGEELKKKYGHIADGVSFHEDGLSNMSNFAKALPGGKTKLEFEAGELKSNKEKFNEQAFAKLGLSQKDYDDLTKDHVWEHAADGVSLELIPRDIHDVVGHTGGSSVIVAARKWLVAGGSFAGTLVAPQTMSGQGVGGKTMGAVKDVGSTFDPGVEPVLEYVSENKKGWYFNFWESFGLEVSDKYYGSSADIPQNPSQKGQR